MEQQLQDVFTQAGMQPKEIVFVESEHNGTRHFTAKFSADVMELKVTPNGDVIWDDFSHSTLLGNIASNLLANLIELNPLRNETLQQWIQQHKAPK